MLKKVSSYFDEVKSLNVLKKKLKKICVVTNQSKADQEHHKLRWLERNNKVKIYSLVNIELGEKGKF